ncbi:sulfurtransferase complex subunit TusD [Marinobacter xestospongiae]|uniref:Sulfurtransferase complex subunit TusD n=1 Tax=Marinobacter xestospongiae TaxID=994319 RepID=A0ABU3W0H3_9GAMM|nr:sulfurtransferase complex subunit TusD [Marinobacter xestospongiae]MDV2079850.1 sulfurtransferase complex subunit TusD [Marinobacter xestospongiae]
MSAVKPVSFTLVITGAPYVSQAPQTALSFARAAVSAGHAIDRVFLYGDGVHLASSLCCAPSDEVNWHREWSDFIAQQQISAVACIASALRRGLVDDGEARRYQRDAHNVQAPFRLLGLGEWVESMTSSSRVLYFQPGGGH